MGSGGAKTGSTWTQSQKTIAQQLADLISPNLQKGATSYTGTLVPNLMPQWQNSLSLLNQYNPNPTAGETSAVNRLLNGKSSYDLSPETTTNWFEKAVKTPMEQSFDRDIAPRIAEGFAGVQGFSSMQGMAQARALSDLNISMGAQLAQGQFQNQQLAAQLSDTAANRQVQGLQFAQQYRNQPLTAALGYQQALAPFQQREDQQAQAAYQDWLRTRPESSPWLAQAQGFLGQQGLFAYNSPNPYAGAAGGAIGGAVLGSGLTGGALGGLFGLGAGAAGAAAGAGTAVAGGVAGGAAAGAASGSFFPGIGTIIGGLIGAGAGYFASR